MRLNDQIDNATYELKKHQLESEKKNVTEKIADTGKNLGSWRKNIETALDFAHVAKQVFETGTRQQKQQVLLGIGSNLRITRIY